MEIAGAIISVCFLISITLLWAKSNVLQDVIGEQGPSGNWRRGYKQGGLWHLTRLYDFGDFGKYPAVCGFKFPDEILEKDRDPEPMHRCPECQKVYVMEKVR